MLDLNHGVFEDMIDEDSHEWDWDFNSETKKKVYKSGIRDPPQGEIGPHTLFARDVVLNEDGWSMVIERCTRLQVFHASIVPDIAEIMCNTPLLSNVNR